MFLMIENDGVAPVQAFTVLGLSSARGNADKIGQFGSGSKHGILTCIRQNITPQIFLGNEPLEFATKDDQMGDKAYKHLIYSFKGEVKELPISLEYGSLDWNGLDMGLREFVSNAIDAGGHKVSIVTNPESQSNKTRVFLPFTPDVSKFFSNLRDKFLHFSPEYNPALEILPKKVESKAKFFRKGVFVREAEKNSLFDYNFGETVKIDESRNMTEYACRDAAERMWGKAPVELLCQLFRNFANITDKMFEGGFFISTYYINKANWLAAWKECFGDAVCGDPTTQSQLIDKATKKGVAVISIPACFLSTMTHAGVPTVNSTFKNVDREGREVKPAGERTIAKVRKIWDKIVAKDMHNKKEFPKVHVYTCLGDAGAQEHGFYNRADKSINLELNFGGTSYCILHELGHYISDASDNTPDFTDFFCKLCTKLMGV